METQRRERLKHSLRLLAESQAATMKLFEATFSLMSEEASLDPRTYFERYTGTLPAGVRAGDIHIDTDILSVRFRNKICFLGSTISLRLMALLIERVNTFVTHETIFERVWLNERHSGTALRSAVKNLRNKLRDAGLKHLAEAIDGTERGCYRLKLF